ncbi:MAG TPA: glucosamine-6-phosphate deaminase, partial [Allocoleopsis sp.]
MLYTPEQTFRFDALSVSLYNNEAELALDAAQFAKNHLQSVLLEKGTASVILATGNSQLKFLDAL